MDLPTVSVVVLNYNGKPHLGDCFASLLAMDYPAERCELILVDNASRDGSVEFVRERFETVRVVQNGANLGFAEGNNRGAQAAHGEYIAFLNPDTRVDAHWLRELVKPCLRDPAVVCVGSRMLSWDGDAIDFADAAMNFMGWGFQIGLGSRRLQDLTQEKELFFACGGGMLIRRDVFMTAGGFDADFFAFFEDVDLGWRLWLMDHQVALAPRAVVYHRHHGSWSSVNNAQKWVLYERNTLASVIKNYDDAHLARVLPAVLLLMIQRAYLDVRPDPHLFGGESATLPNRPSGAHYHFGRIRQLLGERAYGRLIRSGIGRLKVPLGMKRRLLRQPASKPLKPGPDGRINVPAVTISRLMAGCDVLRTFPGLMQKRQVVQTLRRRADSQVFPRFQNALVSNFDDSQFIRAMQVAIARFGLVEMFEGRLATNPSDMRIIEQSQQACQALLQVMDRALTLSGVPEANFRLGGPLPEAIIAVPLPCVSVLTKMNELLWSLPDAPLEEILVWLAAGCQHILNQAHE